MPGRQRGITRERDVRRLLEAEGWWTCRAAGSLGDADVVAARNDAMLSTHPPTSARLLLIEVKSTVTPYAHFGPDDRGELAAAATRAGAQAWLCWWPSRGKPQWIHASRWPQRSTL
jgi:Holliday junction resolvase